MARTADDFRLNASDVLRITRRRPRRTLPPQSVADVFANGHLCPGLRVQVAAGLSAGRTGTLISASSLGWRVALDGLRTPQIIKATDLHPVKN